MHRGHSDIQGASKHMGAYESMRAVQTPPKCAYAPYFHTPPHIWMPPYVQRVIIEYLFCYIIKWFPTLETGMRGCQT